MKEYFPTVNKNKIMKFLGKRRDGETIILSEVTQTQNDKHCMSCHLCAC